VISCDGARRACRIDHLLEGTNNRIENFSARPCGWCNVRQTYHKGDLEMLRKRTIAVMVGATVVMALVPWRAEADQVILDDLIVDGSACIGFDCVNGESFGFDTIRIKENNLRIKAMDTSNSASFPTNDWQLTFNDSSNGGNEKFSLDDVSGGKTPFTVRAGARSNALYVASSGRIGLGTATPSVDLHIKTGNTPTLRLDQDGTSGFTPQTWDVAGNETNFFVRDATNGSTLPFRIRPGAPSNAIYVHATGDVGFGTTTPNQDLSIVKAGTVGIELHNTTATAPGDSWDFRVGGAGNFAVNDGDAGDEFVVTPAGDLRILGDCIQFGGGSFHIPVTAAGNAVITAGSCP
jgi:hypothetical protein